MGIFSDVKNHWKSLSSNQKLTLSLSALAILLSVLSFWYSVKAYHKDAYGIDGSLQQGDIANRLSKILVENSNNELETAKKKLSFDITNTLYKDFYQFDDHNSLVMRKLKSGDIVQDEYFLGLYLSGFEDLYEQCKAGLISRENVRINFQYLINPLCNNQQVEGFLEHRGNGLKLLCNEFYPKSRLASLAKKENGSCK